MNEHEKINYVEFPARDIPATKAFFDKVFGWEFTDFGPEYTCFTGEGLNGGFYQSDLCGTVANGSTLVVFYSRDLESTQSKVEQAGGTIARAIFPFPGGRRFHFIEPSGNEFAAWSDLEAGAGGSEN